ncbi:MAG: phage portal protein, partial [Chromatiaceae bacterium]|nr:phage portal protein [Candidatus Thioaporhodococcus sediminis]
FWRRPEVTQEIPGPELERLICRSWLRDGEVFVQHVFKDLAPYPTDLRYALEVLESDLVPFDLTDPATGVRQGVRKNSWGQALAYAVYLTHPGDTYGMVSSSGFTPEAKWVPASQLSHIKLVSRLHQTRGVSIFHACLSRIDDLKDYESSEQLAARVAADWVGYVKRSTDFNSPVSSTTGTREFKLKPGMIFTDLLPGEDVGIIKSDRPNTALGEFRKAMLKAIAAGTGTRYSAISKSYDGTYSAQRQELVEGGVNYRILFSYLVEQFYLPVWQRFVDAAILGNLIRVPRSIKPLSLYRPEVRPPTLPWIDPLKEVQAAELFLQNRLKSRAQVIRDFGGDPRVVDQQLEEEEPLVPVQPVPPAPPEEEDDEEDDTTLEDAA